MWTRRAKQDGACTRECHRERARLCRQGWASWTHCTDNRITRSASRRRIAARPQPRSRWSGVSLEELVSAELASFNRPEPERIAWEGQSVALTPKQALGLGMVIHELVTNAAKHGALLVATGRVSLRWRTRHDLDPEQLEILWAEHGGPPVQPPARTGFGSRLIGQTVSTDLLVAIDTSFAGDGLICTISIPVAAQPSSGRDR